MKKILALVLAVIMVCTMAFAVTVEGVTPDSSSTSNYAYSETLNPGKSILFTPGDLVTGLTGVTLSNDDIKDGKIKVAVAFERGADLIASRGWVKMGNQYYYALTAKEGVVATDGTVDIIISAITVTKTGVNAPINDMKFVGTRDGKTVYAATSANIPVMTKTTDATMEEVSTAANGIKLCLGFDYGYAPADLVIAADGQSTTPASVEAGKLYTVKRTDVANAKTSITLGAKATAGNAFGYAYTLKAGETVLYTNNGTVPTDTNSAAYKALLKNRMDNDATIVEELENVNMPNKAVTVTFDNAKEGYKMYMVKADGSVVDLGAKFNDNKVLTATAAITGPVIVTDKALTAAGTTTGTTTNPGTGANDVVGVAAALAVVALVSGAAISLKK